MRQFIIGFMFGLTFVGIAWAARGIVLVDGDSNALGTTANPIKVQGV